MDSTLQHRVIHHRSIYPFNYDLAIDWAIELIREGIETENVLILASFSKAADSSEIAHYVSAVLRELGIEEPPALEPPLPYLRYYVEQIITGKEIRSALAELFRAYTQDYDHGLLPFYLLHFAWKDLETVGYNHYYDGATLENIEQLAKDEALKWMDTYIHKATTHKV